MKSLCSNCKDILCKKITENKKTCKNYDPIISEDTFEAILKSFQASYLDGYITGLNVGSTELEEDKL